MPDRGIRRGFVRIACRKAPVAEDRKKEVFLCVDDFDDIIRPFNPVKNLAALGIHQNLDIGKRYQKKLLSIIVFKEFVLTASGLIVMQGLAPVFPVCFGIETGDGHCHVIEGGSVVHCDSAGQIGIFVIDEEQITVFQFTDFFDGVKVPVYACADLGLVIVQHRLHGVFRKGSGFACGGDEKMSAGKIVRLIRHVIFRKGQQRGIDGIVSVSGQIHPEVRGAVEAAGKPVLLIE